MTAKTAWRVGSSLNYESRALPRGRLALRLACPTRTADAGSATGGRASLASDLIRRGEKRLENWARWSLQWTAGLSFPRECSFARLYRPDAGDVWESDDPKPTVDEDDAEAVEQFVRRLEGLERRVVRVCYLGGDAPIIACSKLGVSRLHLQDMLDAIATACARW